MSLLDKQDNSVDKNHTLCDTEKHNIIVEKKVSFMCFIKTHRNETVRCHQTVPPFLPFSSSPVYIEKECTAKAQDKSEHSIQIILSNHSLTHEAQQRSDT